MTEFSAKLSDSRKGRLVLCLMLGLALLAPSSAFADKKKKAATLRRFRSSIIRTSCGRIRRPSRASATPDFYAAEKISQVEAGNDSKKAKWMDRLAGTQPQSEAKVLYQLAEPYGLAVDSKNNLYIADQKVGAIFIFNTETRDLDMIKNKAHAHFVRIIGLAMDDNDRLFVSDPGLRHVLVFNPAHVAEDVITEGMVNPGRDGHRSREPPALRLRHRARSGAGV